jgi:hypothetical protein
MYLFTRETTLVGGQRRPLQYALEITEKVNATIDLDVHLWAAVLGRPVGTLSWNAVVEGRGALGAATAALGGSEAYQDILERGQEFATGPATDTLRQLVHPAELTGEGTAVGNFAEAITAVPAPGQIAAAMGWAVEISELASGIAGVPVTFWADAYGNFGRVTWLIVYPDAAAVDAANDRLNSSAEYIGSIDAHGELFVPASGERALFTRIA